MNYSVFVLWAMRREESECFYVCLSDFKREGIDKGEGRNLFPFFKQYFY